MADTPGDAGLRDRPYAEVGPLNLVWPLLRPMQDAQDRDGFIQHELSLDIGRVGDDKLPGAVNPSRPSAVRNLWQRLDLPPDPFIHLGSRRGVTLLDVAEDRVPVLYGHEAPSQPHS